MTDEEWEKRWGFNWRQAKALCMNFERSVYFGPVLGKNPKLDNETKEKTMNNKQTLTLNDLRARGWIPCVDRMPTEEDGDECGNVCAIDLHGQMSTERVEWAMSGLSNFIAWCPIVPIDLTGEQQ